MRAMFLKVKVCYSSEPSVGVAGVSPEPSPLVTPVPSPSSLEDEGVEGFSGSFSSPPVSPEDFFSSFLVYYPYIYICFTFSCFSINLEKVAYI